jgi:hypothetical protein
MRERATRPRDTDFKAPDAEMAQLVSLLGVLNTPLPLIGCSGLVRDGPTFRASPKEDSVQQDSKSDSRHTDEDVSQWGIGPLR